MKHCMLQKKFKLHDSKFTLYLTLCYAHSKMSQFAVMHFQFVRLSQQMAFFRLKYEVFDGCSNNITIVELITSHTKKLIMFCSPVFSFTFSEGFRNCKKSFVEEKIVTKKTYKSPRATSIRYWRILLKLDSGMDNEHFRGVRRLNSSSDPPNSFCWLLTWVDSVFTKWFVNCPNIVYFANYCIDNVLSRIDTCVCASERYSYLLLQHWCDNRSNIARVFYWYFSVKDNISYISSNVSMIVIAHIWSNLYT